MDVNSNINDFLVNDIFSKDSLNEIKNINNSSKFFVSPNYYLDKHWSNNNNMNMDEENTTRIENNLENDIGEFVEYEVVKLMLDLLEVLDDNFQENVHTDTTDFNKSIDLLNISNECSDLLNELVYIVSQNHEDTLIQKTDRNDINLKGKAIDDTTVEKVSNQLNSMNFENCNTCVQNKLQYPVKNENVCSKDFTPNSLDYNIPDNVKQDIDPFSFEGLTSNYCQVGDIENLSNATTRDGCEIELDDSDVIESCDLVKYDNINHIDLQSLPPDDIESVWELDESDSMSESDDENMITTDFCQVVPTNMAKVYAYQLGNIKSDLQHGDLNLGNENNTKKSDVGMETNSIKEPKLVENIAPKTPKETKPEITDSNLPLSKNENAKTKVKETCLQNQSFQKPSEIFVPNHNPNNTKLNQNLKQNVTKINQSLEPIVVIKNNPTSPAYSKQSSVNSESSDNAVPSEPSSTESETPNEKRKHEFSISITNLTKYFSKGKRAIFSSKDSKNTRTHNSKIVSNAKEDDLDRYDSEDYSDSPSSSPDLSEEDNLKDTVDTGFESDSSTDSEEPIKVRQKSSQSFRPNQQRKSVQFKQITNQQGQQREAVDQRKYIEATKQRNTAGNYPSGPETQSYPQNPNQQLINPHFPRAPILNPQEMSLYGNPMQQFNFRPNIPEGYIGNRQFNPSYDHRLQQPRGFYEPRPRYPPITSGPRPNYPDISHYPQNYQSMFNPMQNYPQNPPNYMQRPPFNSQHPPSRPRYFANAPLETNPIRRPINRPPFEFSQHENYNLRPPRFRPQIQRLPITQTDPQPLPKYSSQSHELRNWIDDLDQRCDQLQGPRDHIRARDDYYQSDSEDESPYSYKGERRRKSQTSNSGGRFLNKEREDSRLGFYDHERRSNRGNIYDQNTYDDKQNTSDSYDNFMVQFTRDLRNPNVSKRERNFRCDVLDEIHKLMPAFTWKEMLRFYDEALDKFERIFYSDWSMSRKEAAVKKILVVMVDDMLLPQQDDIEERPYRRKNTSRVASKEYRPSSSCGLNMARSLYRDGSQQCEHVTTSTMLCKSWNKSGYCRQGPRCSYKHCCIRCAMEDERTAYHPAVECPYFDD